MKVIVGNEAFEIVGATFFPSGAGKEAMLLATDKNDRVRIIEGPHAERLWAAISAEANTVVEDE